MSGTEENVPVVSLQKLDIESMRGRPKSGRSWKQPDQRASSVVDVKPLRTAWDIRQEQREKQKKRKEFMDQIKKEQDEDKERRNKARKEKKKRREENIIKSSSYQIINDTSKVKKMSKKQRKNVMKLADLTKLIK
eukprot:TRINITY_DN2756_c0_g1_i1.p1 TRINITY_DN2756_c0_g1~~TRINITY_DN2756_c0_g1_i1.p1  ORF type:complete len:135 (+),score=46.66 TRINITY_DN2756_c0_g1_i1:37-441(+)